MGPGSRPETLSWKVTWESALRGIDLDRLAIRASRTATRATIWVAVVSSVAWLVSLNGDTVESDMVSRVRRDEVEVETVRGVWPAIARGGRLGLGVVLRDAWIVFWTIEGGEGGPVATIRALPLERVSFGGDWEICRCFFLQRKTIMAAMQRTTANTATAAPMIIPDFLRRGGSSALVCIGPFGPGLLEPEIDPGEEVQSCAMAAKYEKSSDAPKGTHITLAPSLTQLMVYGDVQGVEEVIGWHDEVEQQSWLPRTPLVRTLTGVIPNCERVVGVVMLTPFSLRVFPHNRIADRPQGELTISLS